MDMSARSIFDTLTARTTINTAQLRELVNFLVYHRTYKMDPQEVRVLLSARTLTTTPISTVCMRAIELQKEAVFSFIRIPSNATVAPEVMTYTHVTYDLKQLNVPQTQTLYEIVQSLPEFSDTIVSNVTAMLRRTGEPIDIMHLQATVVRDLLSRSYYNNTSALWLTPSLIRYLCRFYNMSLSSAIGSVYNLTFKEQQAVATIFSLFFFQQVSSAEVAENLIAGHAKLGLGSPYEIADIIARLKSVLGARYTQMNLDDACVGVNALGIGRLEAVNRKFLYTRLRSVGPDVFTSMMALDYPPYWAYLVLLVLSGRKMGLTTTLKRNDLLRESTSFVNDLTQTQSFLLAL